MFMRIFLFLFGIILGSFMFFTVPSMELTIRNIFQASIGFGLIYAGVVILLPHLSMIKKIKSKNK